MSRRGARPLAAKKGTENVAANLPEAKEEEKQGFFSRIFGKQKKEESKQTAAKTRRVRRKSKLAEEDIFADVAALKEEIKEAETHVKQLEKTAPAVPAPPPPPQLYIPPPPPPPPQTPKEMKEHKISKVVGKTNVPQDDKIADVHFELMEAIKNGGRKKLRRISLRRSLGGTPIKEKKNYAPVTDAEIFAASVVIRDESSSDEEENSDDEMF